VSDQPIISDEDLHAYIDGALAEERALLVRQALASDPALAERVAAFQADKAMLKAAYAPLADRPLPAEWIARIQRQAWPQAQPQTYWRQAAAIAAVLLVVVIGPLAWRYQAPQTGADIVQIALDAREGTPAGIRHSATNDDLKTERYSAVLRQAVASNVRIPDLSRMGYRLQGLHLYDRAAEILYRGPQNQLFTLYVGRSDGSARFDQFERRGLRVCIWQDDQISTVMAGDVSAAAMQRLATLSYTGLTS
jgi:anti-sigma factor RsiW